MATWTKIEVGKQPDVLVTCAGWSLKLDASVAWATALAQAFPTDPSYRAGGVGAAYAVAPGLHTRQRFAALCAVMHWKC